MAVEYRRRGDTLETDTPPAKMPIAKGCVQIVFDSNTRNDDGYSAEIPFDMG